MARLATCGGAGGGGWGVGLPQIKTFLLFLKYVSCFSKKLFAKCFLTHGKGFAVCPKMAHDKHGFVDACLPCATHDKAFAMCKTGFAMCLRHTSNKQHPIVALRSLM
jgi:hypothetical protein